MSKNICEEVKVGYIDNKSVDLVGLSAEIIRSYKLRDQARAQDSGYQADPPDPSRDEIYQKSRDYGLFTLSLWISETVSSRKNRPLS